MAPGPLTRQAKPKGRVNVENCDICGAQYSDGGDGYMGLCPGCADATDALTELGVDEQDARDYWAAHRPTDVQLMADELLAALRTVMLYFDPDSMPGNGGPRGAAIIAELVLDRARGLGQNVDVTLDRNDLVGFADVNGRIIEAT